LQEVLKESPSDLEANRALGELLLREGNYEKAIPYLEKALESAPSEEKPEIWVLLGEAHKENGDEGAAEEAFRKALGSKEAPRAHLGLGQLAELRGDAPQAREHYRQGFEKAVGWDLKEQLGLALLSLAPEDTAVRFELARLYERRKRWEEAIRHYQEILRYEPDSFRAWFRLGEAYLAQERPLKAVEALEKALESAASLQERSGVWMRIVRAERLRSEQSGEPLSPKGREALYELARTLLEMGNYRRAAERLAELIAEDPTYRQEDVETLVAQLKEQGVELPTPTFEE
jgi:tetratricopeptide (TPR) repeat protein